MPDHNSRETDYYYRNEVHIEVTNHCNIKCPFCANPSLQYPKGMMTFDVFKNAADAIAEHPHVTALNFVGMGETFLNPNIWEMIDYAHTKGLDLYTCTNGKWRAPEKKLRSIVKLDHIHTTLDAVTTDVLKHSRPNTDAKRIIANLKDILDLKKQMASSTPHVQVRMNVFAFNRHQLFDVIDLCRELGVDSVWIARGQAPEEFQTLLSDDEWDRLPHDYIFTSGFPQSDQIDIDQQTGLNAWRYKTGPKSILDEIGCNGFTIRWDGTATPCCFDFNVSVRMGNIKTHSLTEMWSRPYVETFEKNLLAGHHTRKQDHRTILCDTCNHFSKFLGRNRTIFDLLRTDGPPPSPSNIEAMISAGDLETAERMCHDLIGQIGHDPRALHLLGVIAYRRGHRRQSQELIQRAISESSLLNSRFHDHLAAILSDRNEFQKAQQCYLAANQMQEYAQQVGRKE